MKTLALFRHIKVEQGLLRCRPNSPDCQPSLYLHLNTMATSTVLLNIVATFKTIFVNAVASSTVCPVNIVVCFSVYVKSVATSTVLHLNTVATSSVLLNIVATFKTI